MGPKKGGKKKKGKGDRVYEIEWHGVAEQNQYLERTISSLEAAKQFKTQYAEDAYNEEMKLRSKVMKMEQDFAAEQSTTFKVTADMARQYKSLQDDLIHKINSLETTLTEQKEELDMTQHELRELIQDKDDEIALRDQAISELKQRMEDMSNEFAQMLNSTLKLMKDHMNDKLSGEGDGGEKTDYTQKLQEYSAKAYSA